MSQGETKTGKSSKPILFSGPMVRALLEGRKTQSRRVMKPQPPTNEAFPGSYFGIDRAVADDVKMYSQNEYERLPKHPTDWGLIGSVGVARDAGFPMRYRCPYGQVGDLLWVREVWATLHDEDECSIADITEMNSMGPATLFFRADGENQHGSGKWRPSIHMPRWASRITLEITEVRVQRLQQITQQDAEAEGVIPDNFGGHGWNNARGCFDDLWRSINGKASWESNPFVWALTFRVVTPEMERSPLAVASASQSAENKEGGTANREQESVEVAKW